MSGEIHKEPDGRSLDEIARDLIDPHLTEIFYESGLLEADIDASYTPNMVGDIARVSWASGALFALKNPEKVKRIFKEYDDAEERLSVQEVTDPE